MYPQLATQNPWLFVLMMVLAIWTIPWKGWALWKAARQTSKVWFIVLLIVNTIGILDILYIYIFSKKPAEKKIEPMA
jgi:hypothetical protein